MSAAGEPAAAREPYRFTLETARPLTRRGIRRARERPGRPLYVPPPRAANGIDALGPIVAIRRASPLRKHELARYAGVPPWVIHALEVLGKPCLRLRVEHLIRVSDALGCAPVDLIPGLGITATLYRRRFAKVRAGEVPGRAPTQDELERLEQVPDEEARRILTGQEYDLWSLRAEGKSLDECATAMKRPIATVKAARTRMRRKFLDRKSTRLNSSH